MIMLWLLIMTGRSAFFMLPQFEPVMALVIISGVTFGGETGFLVGAVTMLASNVLFSRDPGHPGRCSAWASSASWQEFSSGKAGSAAAGAVWQLLVHSRPFLSTVVL